MSPDLAVAVDIGGTFTDIALIDRNSGASWRAKTPSTPDDPARAFMTGIGDALGMANRGADALTQVLHGTTVATNMMLEGKGARTALVTTRGFRHVLGIGRQDIPRRANLYTWTKPVSPVPISRIVEVDERIGAGGEVVIPLATASVAAAACAIAAMRVEAVAVCLLHSFANRTHEAEVAAILREALPGVAITVSSDVLPVVREYERTLTTVLNATVMPGMGGYLNRLEARLEDAGARAHLRLMQSNGGVAGLGKIRPAPALTALSGPAAGVVGARAAAQACGIEDIITVDIGGTSADICLIAKGEIGLTQSGAVGNWPLALPMVDMITIGAGGGSIAAIRDGALTVGPESAGAVPGPAAYGRGGERPTVTDAHVVLGTLPDTLLAGSMDLDRVAAVRAVQAQIADPLALDLAEAARGILAIADNHMVGAIRVVSVERGHDPRDFTLVPFGGAGPLHGCALAEALGIGRVLIASSPGVLCADGLIAADLKAEFSQAIGRAGPMDADEAARIVARLTGEADEWLDSEGVQDADREVRAVALLRYVGQGGELAVPYSDDPAVVEASFGDAHRALYGFVLNAGIELVTLRVEATGRARPVADAGPGTGQAVGREPGTARVLLLDGIRDVPVIARSGLSEGDRVEGPAIVTQLDTTTLVAPGWDAVVHASGALILTCEAQ